MPHSLATPLLLATCLSAAPAPALAQEPPITTELSKLAAPAPLPSAEFGWSVDLDGDVLAVGAPGHDVPAPDAGEVAVYRRVAGAWVPEGRLSPHVPDGAEFGRSVAVSGDRVAVGAPREFAASVDRGAVYVFEFDGVAWQRVARLISSPFPHPRLGTAVDIDGDLVAAGAPFDVINGLETGAVYLWRRSTAGWTLEAMLTPSQETSFVGYGSFLRVKGDRVVVAAGSAPGLGPQTGALYVYERVNGAWIETDRLVGWTPPTPVGLSGLSIGDLDDDTLVAISPATWAGATHSGAVLVYELLNGTWTPDAFLQPSDPLAWDRFGSSARLHGERLLVGGLGATVQGEAYRGAAYLFEREAGAWVQRAKYAASDGVGYDFLGISVALSGDVGVAGAYFEDGASSSENDNRGAVYTFDASPRPLAGTPFCLGDGSGTPCPCGNVAPVGAPRGCANSSGTGAWLEATGSTGLLAGDLTLWVRDVTSRQPALLFAGTGAAAGGAGLTFGDGLRCADGAVVRLEVLEASLLGIASWAPRGDLAPFGGAGSTVRLQAWYRDVGGPCASGFNLTNGVELVLAP